MAKRNKLWLSMQAVTLAGVTSLTACGGDTDGNSDSAADSTQQTAPVKATPVYGGEGEGGEGEGEGEGEGAGPADLSTDDLAYLTQLGLMRGHLLVGYQLYQEGHSDSARTHMKHPKSELYAAVVPAFEHRGASGFEQQLADLATAVETDAGKEAVDAAYAALTEAITASEDVVADSSVTPAERLKLAVALLRVAGEEYAIAVVDGKLENAHEYQDALGFTRIARNIVENTEVSDDAAQATLDKAEKLLDDLDPLWPSLIPPQSLSTDASELYGTAAKIELLALGLD